ncbi:hypothetical protein IE81DRAFT_88496 [Ceraceosorus guamensis]|uniref:Uncharacterized protein n=1 Tax=Ceraceosorus guamensis TaxID=1522189 RepID=A0A316W4R0_9BASI|nr:hypothetical protein IE81DRAFT_88496 [Ceraceosorus guamensis]PWN43373.1 hypothetical protein IE81DRAFT_88496 [Ceraceosorus guamensis]
MKKISASCQGACQLSQYQRKHECFSGHVYVYSSSFQAQTAARKHHDRPNTRETKVFVSGGPGRDAAAQEETHQESTFVTSGQLSFWVSHRIKARASCEMHRRFAATSSTFKSSRITPLSDQLTDASALRRHPFVRPDLSVNLSPFQKKLAQALGSNDSWLRFPRHCRRGKRTLKLCSALLSQASTTSTEGLQSLP